MKPTVDIILRNMNILLGALCLVVGSSALSLKDVATRIVGGQKAKLGQFPHQVSLRANDEHFCGGSIINEVTILTAAHCVNEIDLIFMTAVVGVNTLNSGGDVYGVASTKYHPNYSPEENTDDIGIVKLTRAITWNRFVQPIRLARKIPQEAELLVLSGWGMTSLDVEELPNALQYLMLNNYALENCEADLEETDLSIDVGHICTQPTVGKGACMGDSGSPLINLNQEQVGLVSWGVPCAVGKPDVYTAVSFYSDWILKNL